MAKKRLIKTVVTYMDNDTDEFITDVECVKHAVDAGLSLTDIHGVVAYIPPHAIKCIRYKFVERGVDNE